MHIERQMAAILQQILASKKSVLLLGPRQTGKSTLAEKLPAQRLITFSDPRQRQRYERNPGLLIDEVTMLSPKPVLIIIDEVQKVPDIMDTAQYLIDNNIAQCILTGSSARKLKHGHSINLLPGRVIPLQLDALMLSEIPKKYLDLETLISFGSLPEIILTPDNEMKEKLLEGYVTTYLEEEVRAEALVRNLAHFSEFLELAAVEAGCTVNMSKLSQRIGVSVNTINAYYQILEDCLIVTPVSAYTQSKTRHRLNKSKKYLFFDLGVRRVAAREGLSPPQKYWGHLFEQFVGIELIRESRTQSTRTRLRYWKDPDGPEVDWLIEQGQQLTPIEVKWSDKPQPQDARHLELFLNEYPDQASRGYIVCRTLHAMQISERVTAIPWQSLATCFPKKSLKTK